MSTRSDSPAAASARQRSSASGRAQAKSPRLANAHSVKAAQAEMRAAARDARAARREAATSGLNGVISLPVIPRSQRDPVKVRETLDRVESQMPRRSNRTSRERMVIVDARGNVVVDRYGVGNRTPRLTASESKRTAFATMTHNHPNGTSLSADDVRYAAGAKMAAVRAVAPDAIYEIRPGPRGWGEGTWRRTIGPAFYRAMHEAPEHRAVIERGRADVLAGRRTLKDVTLDANYVVARNMDAIWRQIERETHGAIIYRTLLRT